jgi:hypothetical protein
MKICSTMGILLATNYTHNATDCEQSGGVLRWLTFGKEGFHHVDAERQRDYCLRTRPHYHAFDPQSDESEEGTEGLHYVGVISAAFPDHGAEFCIAVSANLKK